MREKWCNHPIEKYLVAVERPPRFLVEQPSGPVLPEVHELDVLVPEGVPAALVLLREVALLAGHLQAVLGGVQALGLYVGGVAKRCV